MLQLLVKKRIFVNVRWGYSMKKVADYKDEWDVVEKQIWTIYRI